MEILTLPPSTVNDNIEFVVAIPLPEVSEHVTPFMLGALDTEQGNTCTPEMYFVNRGQQCEYCKGYESVDGANFTTMQFLAKRVHVLTDQEIEALTDDLVEARFDDEYHASGNW